MKYWRVGLLGVAVSVLAIYVIVRQVNLAQMGEALGHARYGYVMPGVGLLLLGLATRAVRWRVLLNDGLPLGSAFNMMNVAYLVNAVLPLRIGEIARIYLASRSQPGVPALHAASTIIVERLLDLLAVAALIGLVLTTGSVPEEVQAAGLFSTLAALAGFAALVLMTRYQETSRRLVDALEARVALLQRFSVARRFGHFLDGLTPISHAGSLARAVAWTAISWGLSVASGYVLMFAFYEHSGWAVAALYIAAASLAIAVPATLANIGPFEGSILLALGAMGYGEPFDTALAFAVMVHGISLSVYAVTGVVGLVLEGVSLEQLFRGVRDMRQNAS